METRVTTFIFSRQMQSRTPLASLTDHPCYASVIWHIIRLSSSPVKLARDAKCEQNYSNFALQISANVKFVT